MVKADGLFVFLELVILLLFVSLWDLERLVLEIFLFTR
jgi:hypothetical protein